MTNRVIRLVLIRHGAASNVAGRCIGHTDVPLSPEGEASIRHLVEHSHTLDRTTLNDSCRIISSDLLRATESARIIAAATGGRLEFDPRLREMNFGAWDGRKWSAIEEDDPTLLRSWMEHWSDSATPGGESAGDLRDRAADWLDAIAAQTLRDSQIMVVSHAGWIRAAVTHLLEHDITRMFEIPMDHAHATIVDVSGAGNVLVASNVESF